MMFGTWKGKLEMYIYPPIYASSCLTPKKTKTKNLAHLHGVDYFLVRGKNIQESQTNIIGSFYKNKKENYKNPSNFDQSFN